MGDSLLLGLCWAGRPAGPPFDPSGGRSLPGLCRSQIRLTVHHPSWAYPSSPIGLASEVWSNLSTCGRVHGSYSTCCKTCRHRLPWQRRTCSIRLTIYCILLGDPLPFHLLRILFLGRRIRVYLRWLGIYDTPVMVVLAIQILALVFLIRRLCGGGSWIVRCILPLKTALVIW